MKKLGLKIWVPPGYTYKWIADVSLCYYRLENVRSINTLGCRRVSTLVYNWELENVPISLHKNLWGMFAFHTVNQEGEKEALPRWLEAIALNGWKQHRSQCPGDFEKWGRTISSIVVYVVLCCGMTSPYCGRFLWHSSLAHRDLPHWFSEGNGRRGATFGDEREDTCRCTCRDRNRETGDLARAAATGKMRAPSGFSRDVKKNANLLLNH